MVVEANTLTAKPTVILSLSKNLVVWGVTDSGNVGPTSRSLVDLLGKDSSG